jgi:protein XagA
MGMPGQRLALCGIAVLLTLATTPQSRAGAWLQDEGRTQIIFSNTTTQSSRRFGHNGKPLRADRFSKQETTISIERGWSDQVTLLAGARAQLQTFPVNGVTSRFASGAVSGGARIRLWSDGGTILSVQGTLQGSGERSLPGQLRRMDAPVEADLRLNLGHGFTIGSWQAFAEVQTAYRWRGGGNRDELRFDTTFGVRPIPPLLLMMQSFSTFTVDGKGRPGEGRPRQHKLQPGIVYDLSERWSLQVSAFSSIKGRDTIKERGGQAALWRRL